MKIALKDFVAGRTRWILLVCSFLLAALAVIALARGEIGKRAPLDQTASSSLSTPAQKAIAGELITLTSNGFEPASVTRVKGKFVLAVDNRTGLDGVSFDLSRANGASERQKRLSDRRVRWREVVDLPPGNYVLRVSGHPEWSCHINVTAN